MNFGLITGQTLIIENLRHSLSSGRTGHAYVFAGPKGVGKRTVARIFASLLLCESGSSGSSCGVCTACRLTDAGTNPDFTLLEPAGSSIGVDEIRALQSDIIIKPAYSKRKIYLIAEADKLTLQAQNCLLKTLEDPPPYGIIIMTASNYNSLIETIRSRVI
jgi:DNA polymerase-3 subunit delta'